MFTELTEKEHERRRVALVAAQGNGGFATSVAKVGKSVKLKKPIIEHVATNASSVAAGSFGEEKTIKRKPRKDLTKSVVKKGKVRKSKPTHLATEKSANSSGHADLVQAIQRQPVIKQGDSSSKAKPPIPEKGKDGKYALDSRRVALPILVRLCHDNGVEPREGSDFSKTACWLNTLIAGGFVAGITLSEGGKKKISQKKNFPSGSKLPEKWAIALAIPKGSMVSNKDHSSSPSRRRVQAPHLGIGVV